MINGKINILFRYFIISVYKNFYKKYNINVELSKKYINSSKADDRLSIYISVLGIDIVSYILKYIGLLESKTNLDLSTIKTIFNNNIINYENDILLHYDNRLDESFSRLKFYFWDKKNSDLYNYLENNYYHLLPLDMQYFFNNFSSGHIAFEYSIVGGELFKFYPRVFESIRGKNKYLFPENKLIDFFGKKIVNLFDSCGFVNLGIFGDKIYIHFHHYNSLFIKKLEYFISDNKLNLNGFTGVAILFTGKDFFDMSDIKFYKVNMSDNDKIACGYKNVFIKL